MAQTRNAWAINQQEKRGLVTYSTDQENEVTKIFVISLRLIGRTGKEQLSNLAKYSEIWPAKLTNHSACTN